MLDFLMISTRSTQRGVIEIYPKFIVKKSYDLMIRGGDFYAIWIEETGLWSMDEQDALQMIDRELDKYVKDNRQSFEASIRVLHMWDAESGMIDKWHKYCQKQMRDSYTVLDEKLIFANHVTTKKDYASKKLAYPLEEGDIGAFEKLISTLYSEEERHKIEWAIGAIVTGESKKIQKFMVLYGSAGTGKSTILNIVQQLFDGYYSVFDAKALGSTSNAFALEAFKSNPLVAIQHDGDLSKIEDNTRLNSLVSHEIMIVNEKFKSTYANKFISFLMMGTNRPVKITDAKSGLIRRLIDVSPSGEKLGIREYKKLVKQIDFELGAIAYHCQNVFLENPGKYDDYIPTTMLGASNDFYNFVIESYYVFKQDNSTTLKIAWSMYKEYCDDANVTYPLPQRVFKEELRNYFREYIERHTLDDGTRVRNFYSEFRSDKFEDERRSVNDIQAVVGMELKHTKSLFDDMRSDCPAQYATSEGLPFKKWDDVTTSLADLNSKKLHYIRVPENHIVIDFDIVDSDGNKSLSKNLEAANKWPPTYAELSKSGSGVHLHYIYSGDVSKLSRIYDDNIEVKVFTGKSSLRRKLTKCNDIPVSTINSGLPLKGESPMVNFEAVQSEKGLRTIIKRNLNKEIHANTRPSIDFIFKILDDADKSGLKYDVSDMRNAVLAFAANSSNQAEYCIKLTNKMPFKSSEPSAPHTNENAQIIFYDVEVFPNLFLVNWKAMGPGKPIVRMINPSPMEIENLLQYRLVGFNCRRYDNHILYGRLMGYTNEQLYNLSQKIVSGAGNAYFGEAYNISYTDVYDFSSKKQSLKKFQIELGIRHKELGLPWDEPVPESRWMEVAEYCDNDVLATEAVFEARKSDFVARQILAKIAGLTVNDTTNTLTSRIVFGNNRNPQDRFVYRDMGNVLDIDNSRKVLGDEYTKFDSKGRPIFPGYKYEMGESTYRGEVVGEGGYVYSEVGLHIDVALDDVASMHPNSAIAENLWGDEYTQRFKELVDGRLFIKHGDFESAKKIMGGAFAEFLTDETAAYDLSYALKIAINSAYGLTAASFNNPFRDPRNKDNIVAKRGALFMINLKHEIQSRGFTVAHIKTDSIKIPGATAEILQFVSDYGTQYGYSFEHEATYDRMCLVNDAVYVAKFATPERCEKAYGYIPADNAKKGGTWTATGTQFQIPYVFKKLFSREEIEFKDLCETKSVTTSLYLDMNENLPNVEDVEKEYYALVKKWSDGSNFLDGAPMDKIDQLLKDIYKGHDYTFVGRVGEFCPIVPGGGGGILLRSKKTSKLYDSPYASATGAKGYRWLESEKVLELGKEKDIDLSYYNRQVDEAVKTISEYADFEWFASEDLHVVA